MRDFERVEVTFPTRRYGDIALVIPGKQKSNYLFPPLDVARPMVTC